MAEIATLYEQINSELGAKTVRNLQLPLHIESNLNQKFPLREYQKMAFRYFLTYMDEDIPDKPKHNHQLLFHMATGSGKTLVMAGLIIDLYRRGYRNFLFFVNSSNIIQKTKENFLGVSSSKYLFANQIFVDGKIVFIREVESFSDSKDGQINIVFTTIQDLHGQLSLPRENGFSLEDIQDKPVVLLSDESHHVNVDTKRKSVMSMDSKKTLISSPSWESTIEVVFRANATNLLLEFTATMDLQNRAIFEKYRNKLIFDYPLREFRKDGFSKEVSVEMFDSSNNLERAFLAVLMSQHRKRIMLKYRIGTKPVILFKSKTIDESRIFQQSFSFFIEKLDAKYLSAFLSKDNGNLTALRNFLFDNLIDLDELVLEIKEDFSPLRHLVVNSKDESEEKQLALNSLEDSNNGYRCIFAVDKLNEGWDVLNLFDIVRLYDTRDPTGNTAIGARKLGTTTMSEAQLIGRGARYFPFVLPESDDKFRRKFDRDLGHEIRRCETLSYHSAYNPKYIQELNSALQEIGIKARDSVSRELRIKDEFKNTSLYEKGLIFINEQRKRTATESPRFQDYVRKVFSVSIDTGISSTLLVFESSSDAKPLIRSRFNIKLHDMEFEIVLHALSTNPFLTFDNLHRIFPGLRSIREFIESDKYLGSIQIEVVSSKKLIDDLSLDDRLSICENVIGEVAQLLSSGKTEYVGSKEFKPRPIREVFRDKLLNFNIDPDSDEQTGKSMQDSKNAYHLDLASSQWFAQNDCFGTSEEKLLIHFLSKKITELERFYSDIFLLRNEKFFKIYDFKDGSATEPDFVLFLKSKFGSDAQFQVFIEPKGNHLIMQDAWKESLLLSLKDDAKVVLITESKEFKIWGLPFFQRTNESLFDDAFSKLLGLS